MPGDVTISEVPFTFVDNATGETVAEMRTVHMHHSGRHPRAEVRDSETGEVIFPAVKGPLTVIEGDKQ